MSEIKKYLFEQTVIFQIDSKHIVKNLQEVGPNELKSFCISLKPGSSGKTYLKQSQTGVIGHNTHTYMYIIIGQKLFSAW